jgi:hypothetical protein
VEELVAFLKARRALYLPGHRLRERDVGISVRKITDECAGCLKQLEMQSANAKHIQEIANACRHFVGRGEFSSSAEFFMALGALRLVIADVIAKLSATSLQTE